MTEPAPPTYKRGDTVMVRAYPTAILKRIVWADGGDYLLLTTKLEYDQANNEQGEPITVPFPKEDVLVHLMPYEEANDA